MKKRKYIIWTLIALFVFGVAIPVGVAYAARPSTVLESTTLAADGLSYPYQRSTFYDQENDYNYCFFVENYYMKYNSSLYGEEWQEGWVVDDCAGSRNYSIYWDGNAAHMVLVNGSVPGWTMLYYGAGTPNSTGQLETVPKDPQVVAQSTVDCRIIEPMVMVDSLNTYVMVVWTQDCPLAPPIGDRYTVYASLGTYNASGYWEVSIEPTDELTCADCNSRYISATIRYDNDSSVYIIHAENASLPAVKEDSWYLVGNNFNGTSGLFEADQWIMDAVSPENRLLYGYFYSTGSNWEKVLIQDEAIHVVYTQDDDQSATGIYNTTHDWNENDGETWGVHVKNITLPEVGTIQCPTLARWNETTMRYLAVEGTDFLEPQMQWRDFHLFAQTWSDPATLRTINWTDLNHQLQMGWNSSSPLGYDWVQQSGVNTPILYDWFGDQEAVEAGTLGAELLQLVLPILMAILALLATMYVGIRLSTEPKITIIVAMLSCALVGAIAFLIVKQIVGGL